MLVDAFGMPRYWATVWQCLKRGSLAHSTLGRDLSAIERLYRSVEEQTGTDQLDRLLSSGDAAAVGDALCGFFSSLMNSSLQEGSNTAPAWNVAREFVRIVTAHHSAFADSGPAAARLEAAYRNLSPAVVTHDRRVRALPASVVEELYAIADPSPTCAVSIPCPPRPGAIDTGTIA